MSSPAFIFATGFYSFGRRTLKRTIGRLDLEIIGQWLFLLLRRSRAVADHWKANTAASTITARPQRIQNTLSPLNILLFKVCGYRCKAGKAANKG